MSISKRKMANLMKHYKGFRGTATLEAIMAQIPDGTEEFTGKQLAILMASIDSAFHNGRASTGAELIDRECLWVTGFSEKEICGKPIGLIELTDIEKEIERKRSNN